MGQVAAALADALAVLVFVGIGRSAHHHLVGLPGMASTSWPFLTGLALGWAAIVALRRRGRAAHLLAGGVVAWLATVTVGMFLRVASGQGTAAAFVLVALGFLGATMLGWRAVGLAWRARRSPARRVVRP